MCFFVQTNHTRKELFFLIFKEITLRNHSSLHKIFYSLIFEAIALFMVMGSANIKYHFFVNKVATCMFGIYLISDNSYMQDIIWHRLFHMTNVLAWSWWTMILYILVVTLVVFISCGILEFLRQLVFSRFEKWMYMKVNNLQECLGLQL